MDSQAVKARNVTLYPTDWAVAIQVAKEYGLGSVSAGLRFIIRDWQRLKAAAEYKARPHAPAIHVPAAVAQPEEA